MGEIIARFLLMVVLPMVILTLMAAPWRPPIARRQDGAAGLATGGRVARGIGLFGDLEIGDHFCDPRGVEWIKMQNYGAGNARIATGQALTTFCHDDERVESGRELPD